MLEFVVNEIDRLDKGNSDKLKSLNKIKSNTIKEIVYSDKLVPNEWRIKTDYKDLIQNIAVTDKKFLGYLGNNDLSKIDKKKLKEELKKNNPLSMYKKEKEKEVNPNVRQVKIKDNGRQFYPNYLREKLNQDEFDGRLENQELRYMTLTSKDSYNVNNTAYNQSSVGHYPATSYFNETGKKFCSKGSIGFEISNEPSFISHSSKNNNNNNNLENNNSFNSSIEVAGINTDRELKKNDRSKFLEDYNNNLVNKASIISEIEEFNPPQNKKKSNLISSNSNQRVQSAFIRNDGFSSKKKVLFKEDELKKPNSAFQKKKENEMLNYVSNLDLKDIKQIERLKSSRKSFKDKVIEASK